jgi:MFS family permease
VLARSDRTLFVGLLGISWLWFVGATLLTSFFSFAKDILSANADVVTLLLATFSIGIGIGSLLCERLSRHRVELGLVPLGALGMSVFAIDLYFASHHPAGAPHLLGIAAFLGDAGHWRVLADLFLLSVSGGIYSVPLYALIQSRSQPTHRARMIAANNILNSLFMIVSSLMALGLTAFHFTIPEIYLSTGVFNAVVTGALFIAVPEFLRRFKAWTAGGASNS